jgi:hypothetical protein
VCRVPHERHVPTQPVGVTCTANQRPHSGQ